MLWDSESEEEGEEGENNVSGQVCLIAGFECVFKVKEEASVFDAASSGRSARGSLSWFIAAHTTDETLRNCV